MHLLMRGVDPADQYRVRGTSSITVFRYGLILFDVVQAWRISRNSMIRTASPAARQDRGSLINTQHLAVELLEHIRKTR